MKCKCGKPDCGNEVWVDPESYALFTEKAITLNGHKAHETTLLYLDLDSVNTLIEQLEKMKTILEGE